MLATSYDMFQFFNPFDTYLWICIIVLVVVFSCAKCMVMTLEGSAGETNTAKRLLNRYAWAAAASSTNRELWQSPVE